MATILSLRSRDGERAQPIRYVALLNRPSGM